MVLLVALAWAVVAIVCRIGVQLLQQNGRILLHLDSLRQHTELKQRSVHPMPTSPLPTPAGRDAGVIMDDKLDAVTGVVSIAPR